MFRAAAGSALLEWRLQMREWREESLESRLFPRQILLRLTTCQALCKPLRGQTVTSKYIISDGCSEENKAVVTQAVCVCRAAALTWRTWKSL